MVLDQFENLPISDYKKQVLRHKAEGKCPLCSRPAVRGKSLCSFHRRKLRLEMRKKWRDPANQAWRDKTKATHAARIKLAYHYWRDRGFSVEDSRYRSFLAKRFPREQGPAED